MKDLILLPSKDRVLDFASGIFKTDLFCRNPYVQTWVERFAELGPAVFAGMSDAHLEYSHFGTWFGLTYLRWYDDPIVHDLYYLHEFVHAVSNKYEDEPQFTAWFRKTAIAEFKASLETEGYVYLEVPGLREQSFKGEIWADRYLGAERRLDNDHLRDIMYQQRMDAMRSPHPFDYSEQQIAAYARQNFERAGIWKLDMLSEPAFAIVERHMRKFRAGEVDLDEHVEWLWKHSAGATIPFPDQAKLFAPVYWNSKLSYRLRQQQRGSR